eukprot:SAG31_NODE_3306_length_4437_cov_46.404564_6_plen_117_part_00
MLTEGIPLDAVEATETLGTLADDVDLAIPLEYIADQFTSYPKWDSIDWSLAHQADGSGSGQIHFDDVVKFARKARLQVLDHELADLFAVVDSDGDSVLSIDEFELLVSALPLGTFR